MTHLKSLIREVPDFPKPGILFYDITTLLKDAPGLKSVIDGLSANYKVKGSIPWSGSKRADLFSLPQWPTLWARASCRCASRGSCRPPPNASNTQLEYGTDILEIHRDAIAAGSARPDCRRCARHRRHGGRRGASWCGSCSGEVVGLEFVIELDFLKGRDKPSRPWTFNPCALLNMDSECARRAFSRSLAKVNLGSARARTRGPTAFTISARCFRPSRWPIAIEIACERGAAHGR